MPISINGTGTITGISAGGLPDDCITTAEIAGSAVTTAKVTDGNITYGKLSTSATEADNVAKRTAKAWVNFDGTTNTGGNCTIRADFNVSTVADNGTGDYTINFSSNMSGTNYCIAIGVASQSFPSTPEAGTTKSISSCSIKTVTVQSIGGDNKTVADNSSVHAVIFE